MEEIFVNELVSDYKSNRKRALSLALHTVSNIEIPVFNTLSTMSKQNILNLMYHLGEKFKNMSNSAEKSLMITLITDVLTSMIKYKDFYEYFEGNNTYIIHLLCKKIDQIARVRIDEFQIVQSHINQMTKYADRIPHYVELKQCLLNNSSCRNISNFAINQQIVKCKNKSTTFTEQFNFTDVNENVIKENDTSKNLKRKHLEMNSETESIYENENNQNHKKLQEIKPKIELIKTDQSENKLPETKPKNAFDVLMSSAKNKNSKKNRF